MKIIAMILMIPFIARNAGLWILICGRERIPAIIASSPIVNVVVAVKFLSWNLFFILPNI